ncbi:hypothetical protein V3C99_010023 [Haemonchus contortus]
MFLAYILLALVITAAAAPNTGRETSNEKRQGPPKLDKEATDKLPPMDPEMGTFCYLGGYYPTSYYYYGYYCCCCYYG